MIGSLLARIGGARLSRAVLQKGGIGVADQALISLASFVTTVLLARGLNPADFGSFTLVYSILLFAGSIQSALVSHPHGVLAATRSGAAYARFTGALALGQAALIAAGAGLVLLGSVVARVAAPSWEGLLLALVPVIIAVQSHELTRRVLYTEGRLRAAFVGDLFRHGGLAVAIVALWYSAWLSPEIALLAQAATATAGAAVGCWQIRHSIAWDIDLADLRQSWTFGRWLLGGEVVGNWIGGQAHLFIAAAILGPAATGTLKAAQVLFGPLRIIATSLDAQLPIAFSRIFGRDGVPGLTSAMKHAYVLAVPVIAGYCLLVAVLAGPLLTFTYGTTYADQTSVLVLAAVYHFVSLLAVIVLAGLRARQLSRSIFTSDVATTVIAVPLTWLCTSAFGVEGAVVGMILNAILTNTMFWTSYHRTPALETLQADAAPLPEASR